MSCNWRRSRTSCLRGWSWWSMTSTRSSPWKVHFPILLIYSPSWTSMSNKHTTQVRKRITSAASCTTTATPCRCRSSRSSRRLVQRTPLYWSRTWWCRRGSVRRTSQPQWWSKHHLQCAPFPISFANHFYSNVMFVIGGKERTEAMFVDILDKAGLELVKVYRADIGAGALVEARTKRWDGDDMVCIVAVECLCSFRRNINRFSRALELAK